MQISQLNATSANINTTAVAGKNAKSADSSSASSATVVEDILEISSQSGKASSSQNNKRYSADIGRMREIWTEHDRHVESFRKLVATLLNKQADQSNAAGIPWDYNDPNAMVTIDDETKAAAQEAIGEGGAFSVETVATRLLDFAVAISGGDPSKIELLRNAVERGFEAAERQWGGELPEISKLTREAVMNGFDQWQSAGSASAITLLNKQ